MDNRHPLCEAGEMTVQAILFDLDDTLMVDEAISLSAMKETARLAAKIHGVEVARFLADARQLSRSLWNDNPCLAYCAGIGITAEECLWGNFTGDAPDLIALRVWALDFRRRLFDSILRQQGVPDDDGTLAVEFFRARRRLQRLMPDAKETLARLKPAFKIGLLTNGAPDLQREKIAASGLAGFFDAIVVSGELGIGKPKPEIFHHLLGKLDVPPGAAVMVGNSLARDVAGARAAGIARTVWIKVPGSEEFAETTPDHTIVGLRELPPLFLGSGNR
ncbi:MAG: HAD-IA family hydrolase [Chthoniobacterales bacterium]|nr:HAD-IA family hydrolase [Chthoniobacterales bacterium]